MALIVIEHSDIARAHRLARTLRDYGHPLRTVRLHRGDPLPPDLDDVDGIIVCGGGYSANNDSLPWLNDEMSFLRDAHGAGIPIVAICLGSQILARALGGEVGTIDTGPQIGWHDVHMTDIGKDDVVHAGIGWTTKQFHWNEEHVTQLPPEARLLAKTSACPITTWAVGLTTYAFQSHPEVDLPAIEAYANDDPQSLAKTGQPLESLMQQTEQHYAAFERITARLFESIALLVVPVDRRYEGAVKDLHH